MVKYTHRRWSRKDWLGMDELLTDGARDFMHLFERMVLRISLFGSLASGDA